MKKILTIIAALVFTIQILVNISDIFTTPPARAIDISTIPPEERPDEGTFYEGTFYIPVDIGSTVFHIVCLTAGLCLSIAVLLPDKKPKSASLDISKQTKNLAITALVCFSLNLLFHLYYLFTELWSYISLIIQSAGEISEDYSFTDFLKNWVGNTFTDTSIPIAGLCLTVAVLSPYKETKVAAADLGQQAQNIKGMKIKLAIIALVFCSISIVYHSYIYKFWALEGDFYSIAFMLPKIALLCLSIAVLLPYKKTAETSSANTAARQLKN
jgi:hypothetical protein